MIVYAYDFSVIIIKSKREINYIREACRLTAMTIAFIGKKLIKPGITTEEIDVRAEAYLNSLGGKPAFKGYGGYPAAVCISVNDVVIHGIPDNYKLTEGDIVGIDFGAIYKGYYGDAARTFAVGSIQGKKKKLLEVTEQSLYKGIDAAIPGNRVGDISYAVQSHVEKNGFSIVREFVGHGVGVKLHEEPAIPNFGTKGIGPLLKPNMTIAIEPMVNMGKPDVRILSDGWTVVTLDHKPSAHFENSILITEVGNEILTKVEEVEI